MSEQIEQEQASIVDTSRVKTEEDEEVQEISPADPASGSPAPAAAPAPDPIPSSSASSTSDSDSEIGSSPSLSPAASSAVASASIAAPDSTSVQATDTKCGSCLGKEIECDGNKPFCGQCEDQSNCHYGPQQIPRPSPKEYFSTRLTQTHPHLKKMVAYWKSAEYHDLVRVKLLKRLGKRVMMHERTHLQKKSRKYQSDGESPQKKLRKVIPPEMLAAMERVEQAKSIVKQEKESTPDASETGPSSSTDQPTVIEEH